MEDFTHSSEFCPNEDCSDYRKLQKDQSNRNFKKIGFTRARVQQYQCKTCNGTFTETRGAIFYRKRITEHQILETLALLAEGNCISSLTRAKGFKKYTILEWLREATAHAEKVESVLMRDFKVKRGQLDALWEYVGRKNAIRMMQLAKLGKRRRWTWTDACGQPEALGPMKPRLA